MLSRFFSPPIARWMRWGALAGAVVGLGLSAYVEWYFTRGPASASTDAGMAHAFIATVIGFPFTILSYFLADAGMLLAKAGVMPATWAMAASWASMVLAAAMTWAMIGAAVAGIMGAITRRIRGTDLGPVPAAE